MSFSLFFVPLFLFAFRTKIRFEKLRLKTKIAEVLNLDDEM